MATISINSGPIALTQSADNPLTILSGVTISAPNIAVYGNASRAWTIGNAGNISIPCNYGIELAGGGYVSNIGSAAVISAYVTGVWLKGGAAEVTNESSIAGNADGVILSAGGTLNNYFAAATISGWDQRRLRLRRRRHDHQPVRRHIRHRDERRWRASPGRWNSAER